MSRLDKLALAAFTALSVTACSNSEQGLPEIREIASEQAKLMDQIKQDIAQGKCSVQIHPLNHSEKIEPNVCATAMKEYEVSCPSNTFRVFREEGSDGDSITITDNFYEVPRMNHFLVLAASRGITEESDKAIMQRVQVRNPSSSAYCGNKNESIDCDTNFYGPVDKDGSQEVLRDREFILKPGQFSQLTQATTDVRRAFDQLWQTVNVNIAN